MLPSKRPLTLQRRGFWALGLSSVIRLSRLGNPTNQLSSSATTINQTRQYANAILTELQGKDLKKQEKEAELQLRATNEPYHVAEHVKNLLKKNKLDEALIFTAKASKKANVVVSWNHLIDYKLRQNQPTAAIKLYNDMKKRGQLPNALTFTTIFKGLADSEHSKLAVSESVKLYTNMLASERLKPNTIHMNAVLHVCAKALDLESLFTVVASADGTTRIADQQTYTTIFHAIRAKIASDQDASGKHREMEDVQRDTKQAVEQAYAVWDEVMSKWRKGDITLDEKLVCSFGRVLLLGDKKDLDAIPSLIEVTMNIRPQTVGDSKGLQGFVKEALPGTGGGLTWTRRQLSPEERRVPKAEEESRLLDTEEGQRLSRKQKEEILSREEEQSLVGIPVAQNSPRDFVRDWPPSPKGPFGYAVPGNNVLGLVLDWARIHGGMRKGTDYWHVLVPFLKIKPDQANYLLFMRLCRRFKSSSRASDQLVRMPQEFIDYKHIRAALATCLADNLNAKSFKNATEIVQRMKDLGGAKKIDIVSLRLYHRIAYAAGKRDFTKLTRQDPEKGRFAMGRQLHEAIETIQGPYDILYERLNLQKYSAIEDNKEWLQRTQPTAELVALARKLIATIDRLIFQDMVPQYVGDRLKRTRNDMNRFVVDYFEQRKQRDPNFDQQSLSDTMRDEAGQDDFSRYEVETDDWDAVESVIQNADFKRQAGLSRGRAPNRRSIQGSFDDGLRSALRRPPRRGSGRREGHNQRTRSTDTTASF